LLFDLYERLRQSSLCNQNELLANTFVLLTDHPLAWTSFEFSEPRVSSFSPKCVNDFFWSSFILERRQPNDSF
jgi:hypothetical protein